MAKETTQYFLSLIEYIVGAPPLCFCVGHFCDLLEDGGSSWKLLVNFYMTYKYSIMIRLLRYCTFQF